MPKSELAKKHGRLTISDTALPGLHGSNAGVQVGWRGARGRHLYLQQLRCGREFGAHNAESIQSRRWRI